MASHIWWLVVGVIGFYAYDTTLLLYHNEVVFFKKSDGQWTFSVGSDFQLTGRHVFVPALFAPQRPLLRLSWSSRHERGKNPRIRGLRAWRAGMALTAPSIMLIGAVFASLPLLLIANGSALALLAWMFVLYLTVGIALVRTWRLRRLTGLSGKGFASLASDALLCAPYALNLLRKQGMHGHAKFDFESVALALLDAGERTRLVDVIRGKLQHQMDVEDVDSERHVQILKYLNHIEGALT
jgi:hypothetical protein